MDEIGRSGTGGSLGDYAMASGARDRPMSEVVGDIFGNIQEMVRSELRLVRAEMREETSKAASAGAMLAAGGVVALFAVGFLLVCAAQLLALVMPAWAAALSIGIVLGIAGLIMVSIGRSRLQLPKPEKAIENMKENIEWMKNQTRS